MLNILFSLDLFVILAILLAIFAIGFVLWLNSHPKGYGSYIKGHAERHKNWMDDYGKTNRTNGKF